MTVTLEAPDTAGERLARPRQYLMCPPEHFTVEYAINPWMNTDQPCDSSLALRQWQRLRDIYQELGHDVRTIEPLPQLPDMVFAANGGLVIAGRALAARFAYPQRADEGPAYLAWLRAAGFPAEQAEQVNEGEGDFLVVGGRVLAGTGFRTEPKAHAEVSGYFGLPVVSLELVNPRFYHLDTALAVLDDRTVAYYPDAFSPASRAVLRELYPDAVLADAEDAMVFGLNAVSDGRNVVLAEKAVNLAERLRERGFHPIGVDLSELLKAGGSAKCCTLEIRS